MMRILRNMHSSEVQSQMAALRGGSKDEIITQLQIALEMYSQVKEKLEYSQEELLDAKIEVENQRRELIELRKAAKATNYRSSKSKREPEQQDNNALMIELENDTNVSDDNIQRSTHSTIPNVPSKFVQRGNIRTLVPDGAGGSRGVLETGSGKRFII